MYDENLDPDIRSVRETIKYGLKGIAAYSHQARFIKYTSDDVNGFYFKALALADAFKCGINELPLSIVLSWYEQKAVADLLALLSLGVKGIYLGPSLPAFLSPNVLQFLVDNFDIKPISTPDDDLKQILG